MVHHGRTMLTEGLVVEAQPHTDGTATVTLEKEADNGKRRWVLVVEDAPPVDELLGRGAGWDAAGGLLVMRDGRVFDVHREG